MEDIFLINQFCSKVSIWFELHLALSVGDPTNTNLRLSRGLFELDQILDFAFDRLGADQSPNMLATQYSDVVKWLNFYSKHTGFLL
ncbi:hypothetical protein L2E82_38909 [Cichorium intybus]|uniref:Uncharacterized protein n=1 Tax=Cichorium intybus TaxID=13427 RepID=A0ACB9AL36_CICIN|nr:hypothetical protein L2E82_38909 [Cichorium intybus]